MRRSRIDEIGLEQSPLYSVVWQISSLLVMRRGRAYRASMIPAS